jgi:hypothetical protein
MGFGYPAQSDGRLRGGGKRDIFGIAEQPCTPISFCSPFGGLFCLFGWGARRAFLLLLTFSTERAIMKKTARVYFGEVCR